MRRYDNFKHDREPVDNRPCLRISIEPPDWYLEKLERERKEEEGRVTSYEVDYTIRDNDRCVVIKDI